MGEAERRLLENAFKNRDAATIASNLRVYPEQVIEMLLRLIDGQQKQIDALKQKQRFNSEAELQRQEREMAADNL